MKVKGWMAIAMAITVAGSSTSVLARTIANSQAKEVTKVVQTQPVANIASAGVSTGSAAGIKSSDDRNRSQDYKIEKGSKSTKKTKADLPMKEAVSQVVQTIYDIFGDDIVVQKVVEVDLTEIGLYDDRHANPNSDYRAYTGVVVCEGNIGFGFTIHSITGQVTELSKYTNQIDAEYEDPEAGEQLGRQIVQEAAKYKKTAKEFIGRNLTNSKVTKCEVLDGSYAGKSQDFHWERILANVSCETADGTLYSIWIDPKTDEVLSCQIMGWGE